MANDNLPVLTVAEQIEHRKLDIEERRIAIEEQRAAAERAANRSPDEIAFDLEQRMAKTLAASPFLPANVGKDATERTAAAWGVLRYARMLGVDPYVLAQQIYVVHGRLGFSSQFLIALVNGRAELRSPIDWTIEGDGPTLAVTCSATDRDGRVRSVRMTRAEVNVWGWAGKSDPWKADPALMMRYRTAAKLIRLYFAGSVMGLTMTAEELRDLAPADVATSGAPALVSQPTPRALPAPTADPLDAVFSEPTAEEKARIAAEEREEAGRAK